MSIGQNNGGNMEGKIKKEGAVGKATPIEGIKVIKEGDKKIELKTAESEEDRDKKIQELKKVMNKMDERNEDKNKEGNNEGNEGGKKEDENRAFEINSDSVDIDISDSLDEDSGIVNKLTIDSEGNMYGDDKLDYEGLSLKFTEAKDALNRLEKKKSELPSTNRLSEIFLKISLKIIEKVSSHDKKDIKEDSIINFEINRMLVAKANEGISRLKKRVKYLEGRISKELS